MFDARGARTLAQTFVELARQLQVLMEPLLARGVCEVEMQPEETLRPLALRQPRERVARIERLGGALSVNR